MEEFDVRAADGIVAVVGELDVATAPELEHVLASFDGAPIVVDLTRTSFLDSTGLKILMRAAKHAASFAIVCPAENHPVMRVLTFAGVEQAYPVVETVDEAPA